MQKHITEVAYNSWISRIKPVSLDFSKGVATLEVPNEFHRQTLNRCYYDLLTEAFGQVFGSGIQIDLRTPDELNEGKETAAPEGKSDDYEFTFDTFIVGPSNKFAHAASLAVATKPAALYNPLFIYGNSGLGKTHLLYAICNEISRTYPDMNIIYIKGDDFTNEIIEAIRKGTTPNSARNTVRPTRCWWTISSLSQARSPRRRSSSTPSIPSTSPKSRLSSPPTVRPRTSPLWKTG